jgi:RNA polymerase sigma factor (sigma-70 family)
VHDERVTESSEIERVYRETGDRLWWALLAYTGDRELASDAVAEAFARALDNVGTIRNPSAWVWKVAFRVATTQLRAPRGALEREVAYEMDERAVDVMLALKRLTARQRAVFVLFYLDDRPTAEIAGLLGMSKATVSVHLHRARRSLREILGDHDV